VRCLVGQLARQQLRLAADRQELRELEQAIRTAGGVGGADTLRDTLPAERLQAERMQAGRVQAGRDDDTLRAERPTTARGAKEDVDARRDEDEPVLTSSQAKSSQVGDAEARPVEDDSLLAARPQTSRDAALDATASRLERHREVLRLRMRQDEAGLREITRVVAERGPSAAAVQLGVFPSGGDRMAADARPARAPAVFSFIP
jgi:hypothetical protein